MKSPILSITPAARFPRFAAALLDIFLAGLFGFFLLSRILLPSNNPSFEEDFREWQQEVQEERQQAIELGETPEGANWETMPSSVRRGITFSFNILLLVFWFYFSLTEFFLKGSTLGKKMFGLKTYSRINFQPPQLWACLLRGGLKTIVILYTPLLWLAFLTIFFTSFRLAGYEFLVKTVVLQQHSSNRENKSAHSGSG